MKIFIIAEAGVNHNGDLETALKLVAAAAKAGADAVKFQTFKAEEMVRPGAPKADYQKAGADDEGSQFEMLKALELGMDAFRAVADGCRKKNIEFMSTPFDLGSVDFLLTLGVKRLKISSGDITNAPLLLHVSQTGLPVILSTGMATLGEVEAALGVLAFGLGKCREKPSEKAFKAAYASVGSAVLRDKVTLLHCTSQYPAPFEDVNLRAMDTLAETFGLDTGYSDHTLGISVPVAAAARAAVVIEKHFTLNKAFPGPDHAASLDPKELADMVRALREVESALGAPEKKPAPSERQNMPVARKSLVAAKEIQKGDMFSSENLACKRPGTGISPMRYFDFLGRPATRDYHKDERIS